MLIALPIGFWIGSFVFDVLGGWLGNAAFGVTGYYLAVAGCIGGILAALPGAVDWFSVVPSGSRAKSTGAIHGLLNVTVLVLFGIEVYLRSGGDHLPSGRDFGLSALGVVLLGVSGWLGGSLIYDYHIAVNEPAGEDVAGRTRR